MLLGLAFSDQTKDSYLDGYYDGSQPDHRFLPQSVREQIAAGGVITDQSQKQTNTDHAWYWGCQSWQAGCWADPGWQIGVPFATKVKADPSDFYNNVDNHAYRLSALYVIDDSSDLNVQYEVFQDDGAGWQNTYSCEMMAKRSGKDNGRSSRLPSKYL